jgi:hypothetical protein
MRPVTINPQNVQASLIELANASQENDVVTMAQNFDFTGTPTQTTNLNVSSPTLANVTAVLATFLQVHQKGGINRTT